MARYATNPATTQTTSHDQIATRLEGGRHSYLRHNPATRTETETRRPTETTTTTVTRFHGDLWNSTNQTRQAYATSHGGDHARPLTTGLWMYVVEADGSSWMATDEMVKGWAWRTTTNPATTTTTTTTQTRR